MAKTIRVARDGSVETVEGPDPIREVVRERLVDLRERYDAGDLVASLEAFLLVVGVAETYGEEAVPPPDVWWGGGLPLAFDDRSPEDVRVAREIWTALAVVDDATVALHRVRSATEISDALRDLLGGIWTASRAARSLGGDDAG